jgi:hypothetical protein
MTHIVAMGDDQSGAAPYSRPINRSYVIASGADVAGPGSAPLPT